MQQPRHWWYLSHDLKEVRQVNSKIMANCLHCQILFWKFYIFLWFPMFLRIFPTGRNGGSTEYPGGSPSCSWNLPVYFPNQILIPPLSNDFQVIT